MKELSKIFHPQANRYIYIPKEQVDMQTLMKELYEYQQLDLECQRLSNMNLFQLFKGQTKVTVLDAEEVEKDVE